MPAGRADYFFGEVAGQPVGSEYRTRKDAMRAGVHNTAMAGISGNARDGANCVVLNRGYKDDEDHGDWILYTGAGGNDSRTKQQVADQQITYGPNAALVFSQENGLPVRLLRGYEGERPHAPSTGYRYDGLFKVTSHWADVGQDGYLIWRFRLTRLSQDEAAPWTPEAQRLTERDGVVVADVPRGNAEPERFLGLTQRIVRSTPVSQFVKQAHDFQCQVCSSSVDLPVGQYVEGAHIRALGAPHGGPDSVDNMLSLCPNHHVAFDGGGIYVDATLTVRDHAGQALGPLQLVESHSVSEEHLQYHRRHHGFT